MRRSWPLHSCTLLLVSTLGCRHTPPAEPTNTPSPDRSGHAAASVTDTTDRSEGGEHIPGVPDVEPLPRPLRRLASRPLALGRSEPTEAEADTADGEVFYEYFEVQLDDPRLTEAVNLLIAQDVRREVFPTIEAGSSPLTAAVACDPGVVTQFFVSWSCLAYREETERVREVSQVWARNVLLTDAKPRELQLADLGLDADVTPSRLLRTALRFEIHDIDDADLELPREEWVRTLPGIDIPDDQLPWMLTEDDLEMLSPHGEACHDPCTQGVIPLERLASWHTAGDEAATRLIPALRSLALATE